MLITDENNLCSLTINSFLTPKIESEYIQDRDLYKEIFTMSMCVLMSTYNGAKYIEEQIKSIENQEMMGAIEIFIRDDSSTDNTIELIRNYSKTSNINISIHSGTNLGPSGSFLELISMAPDADFYAFCDQDDVWLPGKIIAAETALRVLSVPALWISNYDVTDDTLNIIEHSALIEPESNQFKALFYNNVPGCTMDFNKALLFELRKLCIKKFRMHDILTLCVALITGEVLFDKTPYIYYRQHESNTVGKYSKKIKPFQWIIDKLGIIFSDESFNYTTYSKRILEIYYDRISENEIREYRLIETYQRGMNRFELLKRPYTRGSCGRTAKSIRMRILLGKI